MVSVLLVCLISDWPKLDDGSQIEIGKGTSHEMGLGITATRLRLAGLRRLGWHYHRGES
jgi:hypothetical protein